MEDKFDEELEEVENKAEKENSVDDIDEQEISTQTELSGRTPFRLLVDIYFCMCVVMLLTIAMPFVRNEQLGVSISLDFMSFIQTVFSGGSGGNLLTFFLSLFYIVTLVLAIRGLIICIKSFVLENSKCSRYGVSWIECLFTILANLCSLFIMIGYLTSNSLSGGFGFILYVVAIGINCYILFANFVFRKLK